MDGNNLLKAAAVTIPLMGIPAGAAQAECLPVQQEKAGIELVIIVEVVDASIPAWGEGNRGEVPAFNPITLLTEMRDPANSMVEPAGLTYEGPKSRIEILAGDDNQVYSYIGERVTGLRKPLSE